MLFTLIFLLQGGRHIFAFVTKIFPTNVRDRVRDAGRAGFHSLIGYVRATFLVALVDAVGIGTGLAIMGIPLALPLASLVFLGAFIPLVGAVLAGGLAVIVALIAKGWVYALITFGLIIAVQQLEAHVLQPLVMGRAVSLHPLAVVLAIAAGGCHAGHRRRPAGRADRRLPQQRDARAAGRRPGRRGGSAAAEDGPPIEGETDDVERPGRATRAWPSRRSRSAALTPPPRRLGFFLGLLCVSIFSVASGVRRPLSGNRGGRLGITVGWRLPRGLGVGIAVVGSAPCGCGRGLGAGRGGAAGALPRSSPSHDSISRSSRAGGGGVARLRAGAAVRAVHRVARRPALAVGIRVVCGSAAGVARGVRIRVVPAADGRVAAGAVGMPCRRSAGT